MARWPIVYLVVVIHTSTAQLVRLQPSVSVTVLHAPTSVTIAAEENLYYELQLVNFSEVPLFAKSIGVFNSGDSTQITFFEGAALTKRVYFPGMSDSWDGSIDPGKAVIIYIEVANSVGFSSTLYHRVVLQTGDGDMIWEVDGGNTKSTDDVVTLGPPLKGGPWAAVYSAEWERGHRRVIYTEGGRAQIGRAHV